MSACRRRRAGGAAVAVLVVAMATALVGGSATTATAAFPGTNGKIAFQTNRDGNEEIYTMNADGTSRLNLTRQQWADIEPRWSSTGDRIAFASNRDGNYEIFTMNADGSDVTQVTHTTGVANRGPSWTYDGRIVFHRGAFPDRDIVRINADGSGLAILTPGPLDSAWAAPAPHSPMLAFSQYRITDGQRLYTLNTITGLVKPAAEGSVDTMDREASWSPTGNDLVFTRAYGGGSELYVVHKDGTELRQITDTPERTEQLPSFSPDGTKIVFAGCVASGSCANYTRNIDGTEETKVTRLPQAPYLDTFSGDWIDPFWHLRLSGTGSSLTQADGRLLEGFAADSQQGGEFDAISAHVGSNCRLVGDFDVQADFSLDLWPSANGVQVTLYAFETLGQVLRDSQIWGEQYATWIPPTFTNVATTDLSGSLRLARTGSTLTGYYRSGSDWVEIASGETNTDAATIGLSTSSFLDRFSHEEVLVAWDDFRITNGELACPTWWTDTTPDWQPLGK